MMSPLIFSRRFGLPLHLLFRISYIRRIILISSILSVTVTHTHTLTRLELYPYHLSRSAIMLHKSPSSSSMDLLFFSLLFYSLKLFHSSFSVFWSQFPFNFCATAFPPSLVTLSPNRPQSIRPFISLSDSCPSVTNQPRFWYGTCGLQSSSS